MVLSRGCVALLMPRSCPGFAKRWRRVAASHCGAVPLIDEPIARRSIGYPAEASEVAAFYPASSWSASDAQRRRMFANEGPARDTGMLLHCAGRCRSVDTTDAPEIRECTASEMTSLPTLGIACLRDSAGSLRKTAQSHGAASCMPLPGEEGSYPLRRMQLHTDARG